MRVRVELGSRACELRVAGPCSSLAHAHRFAGSREVLALAKGSDAGLRHLVVLIHCSSAHSYRADHRAIAHQRDAACEDDDPAAVSGVDAEERLARLSHLADLSLVRPLPAEVKALSMAMSILATQAPSIRWKAKRFLPASITAMFIGWPICWALCSAAEMIL